jgi:hypothetical protein
MGLSLRRSLLTATVSELEPGIQALNQEPCHLRMIDRSFRTLAALGSQIVSDRPSCEGS